MSGIRARLVKVLCKNISAQKQVHYVHIQTTVLTRSPGPLNNSYNVTICLHTQLLTVSTETVIKYTLTVHMFY